MRVFNRVTPSIDEMNELLKGTMAVAMVQGRHDRDLGSAYGYKLKRSRCTNCPLPGAPGNRSPSTT